MHERLIREVVSEHEFITRRFFEHNGELIGRAITVLVRAVQSGGKLILFGSGGSAATAARIAAKLLGRVERDRPPLPAIALANDSASVTAIANDYEYGLVFARQIEALATRNDAAVAISISGHSESVLEGIRACREREVPVVGLLGREGGRARDMVDVPLVVGAQKAARIQELHVLIGHLLCEAIEAEVCFRRE